MKKSTFLFSLALITSSTLGSVQTQRAQAVGVENVVDSAQSHSIQLIEDTAAQPVRLPGVLIASCADPAAARVEACELLERRILASTVRIEWYLWLPTDEGNVYTIVQKNIGHATIKEGRYLVTHNHWNMLTSGLERGESITLSVFSADGDPVWLGLPLEAIKVTEAGTETLVLDFGVKAGQGLFEKVGLLSAEFMTWDTLPVQSGMEVAQVNWDGATARVEWVTIDEVIISNEVASLEMDSYVLDGTSGGGVFWNGYHIANTWYRGSIHRFWDRKVVRQYSVAALNPPPVATP